MRGQKKAESQSVAIEIEMIHRSHGAQRDDGFFIICSKTQTKTHKCARRHSPIVERDSFFFFVVQCVVAVAVCVRETTAKRSDDCIFICLANGNIKLISCDVDNFHKMRKHKKKITELRHRASDSQFQVNE